MASVRDDLIGVVWVESDGERVALSAGDSVPAGVELGDHLVKSSAKKQASSKSEK